MGITEPAALATLDAVRALARGLDAAEFKRRGELVDEFAGLYGWSRAKVYRELGKVGWASGRKPRSDRGTSSQAMDVLQDVSAALKLGVRQNGKATMHTPNAVSLLAANGREINVSNGRINQLLRQHQMHLAAQRRDRAVQPTRSLHPNHVHQVDPSLCILYYLPDGTQRMVRDDEVYKNKPQNAEKLANLRVWRYVMTDHYSGTILVRYFQARGETQANLWAFLLHCWQKLDGRTFHGVPKILIWDKGSANTAAGIKNGLRALQVQAIEHASGNARAKGSVENGNNLVECLFESRLQYEPVADIDELNAAADNWCNAYNADAIPSYDARLKRKYMDEPKARYSIWQTIRREQLRVLPDVDLCRMLLSADPIERDVKPDLTISFKHPGTKHREFYDVSDIPGIYISQKVKVSPLVYGTAEVLVTVADYKGDETTHVLKPVPRDGFAGFRADAAVIGEEFKSQPDTVAETAGKAADQAAFPGLSQEEIERAKDKGVTPFGGLDAHSHLKHVNAPAYMDRPGEAMNVPNRLHVEVRPLGMVEACRQLRGLLGRPVEPEENAQIRAWYPDGVPEEDLQKIVDQLTGAHQVVAPRLAVVR